MKILYLANDRRAAELSTPALRLISPDVAAAWASDREEARRWLAWNRDVAAVIIDVESDAPAWTSFVSQIRALGVAAPLVVVSAREPALRLAALEAVADAVVVKDASFPALLPDAVRGALHGSRKAAPKPIAAAPARRRLRMLYVGDATLAKECLGRSLDVVEAAPERGATLKALPLDTLAGAQPAFDVILIEHAHPGVESRGLLRDISARRLQVPVVIVAEWDEALAVSMLELGAVDIVANSRASLRAVLFRLHRLIAHATLLKEYSALRNAGPQLRLDRPAREPASSEDQQKDAELAAARLAEAAEARQQIERRLAQREIEFRHAEQRATVELQTALRDFTRREAELEAALAREAAQRDALQTKLDEAGTALADATQRAASEERDREHTIERQVQIEADLTRESAARAALQQQLANAKIALQRAEARSASAAATADERLADAQARFDARLSEAAATQAELDARLTAAESARGRVEEQAAGISNSLERKLVDLTALLERAEQQVATERRAAANHAAEREAAFDLEIATALANRQQVEKALEAAHAALAKARNVSTSQLEAAAARQTDLAAQVAQAVANRQALEHAVEAAATRLAEHQTQAEAQLAQAAADAASAIEAAEKRAAGERQLAAERSAAAIDTLEQRLAVMAASLEQAAQDAAAERRVASEQASAREARFDRDLAGEVANRRSLEKALEDVKAARAHTDREHAAQIAAAKARLSELTSQSEARIAQVGASAATAVKAAEERAASERRAASEQAANAISALERRLADAGTLLERAEQQAIAERQATSAQTAERQARFDTDLAREVANRLSLAKALEDARAARAHADREHAAQVAAAAAQLADHQTQARGQLAQAAASAAAALEAASQTAASERQAAAEQAAARQARFEADLAREVASRQSVEKALEDATAARARADREHAAQIAAAAEQATARQAAFDTALEKAQDQTRRLESALTEERTQHGALQHSFDQARAAATGVQHRLDTALADISRDRETIAQLHGKIDTLGTELDATRSEREALRAEAVLVPQLRTQIDDILAGRRREFDHAAVSLCRWQRDGGITRVNHAAVGLLGYDTPEELQKVDFDRDVFESGDELQWLVDRCLTSGATESIETTWMKKDGARIIVRVLAASTNRETVDLAVQDITTLRVLEEKLRHSQRMESVARYGSEVAVTCDNLLRHVEQEGQDWLSQIDSPTARYHGQLLLDEVTRAAAFLRQLAVYGDEQKNAAELVDVNEVLVDLEPVLSRVAGPNIDFVLPKSSRPLNLDVDAERVERILVNVAAYGRERMPSGGRLVIEVAPVMLDRAFVAKYPNVRPGAHVLLTVNELRSKAGSQGSRESQAGDGNGASPAPPGVDLGALQALVSDCGGHLWMKADPPGDMVLKIHLPRRVLDRPEPRTPVKQPVLARWLSRVAGVQH